MNNFLSLLLSMGDYFFCEPIFSIIFIIIIIYSLEFFTSVLADGF